MFGFDNSKSMTLCYIQSTKKLGYIVLRPNREGQFKVLHSLSNGAYKLGYPDERVVSKACNVKNLRKYYQ